jgi:hypothetical protein
MPYGNKLLSIDQLLAAWQNRNQMENNSSQTAMQQKLAEKQLEAQDLANKKAALEMDLITSPFNIQRERWAGSGNANTPGVDKAISDNQKMQKLSMLTGKNMPNMGITGYGGGWGDRGHGDGGGEIQRPAPGGYEYYGPDHSKEPTTVEAATQLGNIMREGVPQQAPTIADLMAEEQGNVAGMQSLVNQAGNRGLGDKVAGAGLTDNMEPTKLDQSQKMVDINTQFDTWMKSGSTVPPKEWPEEMRNTAANLRAEEKRKADDAKGRTERRKSEQSELSTYQNKLYSNPDWKSKDDPIPQEIKAKIKQVLPGFVRAARSKNPPQEPDIQNLIDSFKEK